MPPAPAPGRGGAGGGRGGHECRQLRRETLADPGDGADLRRQPVALGRDLGQLPLERRAGLGFGGEVTLEPGDLRLQPFDVGLGRCQGVLRDGEPLGELRLLREEPVALPAQLGEARVGRWRQGTGDRCRADCCLLPLAEHDEAEHDREQQRQQRQIAIEPDGRHGIVRGHALGQAPGVPAGQPAT
ncbi:MAG: hypothetical protein R3D25_11775 [Geminicoccaceae bacterium]